MNDFTGILLKHEDPILSKEYVQAIKTRSLITQQNNPGFYQDKHVGLLSQGGKIDEQPFYLRQKNVSKIRCTVVHA